MQLLYWPQTATTKGDLASSNTAPITAETLGTTLTSPTLYISFTNVFAHDGCNGVGTPISSTIVAIPTDQPLSSVLGYPIPCDAHMRATYVNTYTASFNVTDMNSPVPYDIYTSMPRCATEMRCPGQIGSGTSYAFSCATSDAYRPILVVPEEVLQSMEPAWSTCHGDIRGVYDPPRALQPAASVAGPEVTVQHVTMPTMSATPASGPQASTPSPTASKSVVAIPDSVGGQTSTPDAPDQSVPQPSGSQPSQQSIVEAASESDEQSQVDRTSAGAIVASLLAGAPPTNSDLSRASEQHSDASDPGQVTATQPQAQPIGHAETTNAGAIVASLLAGALPTNSDLSWASEQHSGASDPGQGTATQPQSQPFDASPESSRSNTVPVIAESGSVVAAQGTSGATSTPDAYSPSSDQPVTTLSSGVVVAETGTEVNPSVMPVSAPGSEADPAQQSADPTRSHTESTGPSAGTTPGSSNASPPSSSAVPTASVYTATRSLAKRMQLPWTAVLAVLVFVVCCNYS